MHVLTHAVESINRKDVAGVASASVGAMVVDTDLFADVAICVTFMDIWAKRQYQQRLNWLLIISPPDMYRSLFFFWGGGGGGGKSLSLSPMASFSLQLMV